MNNHPQQHRPMSTASMQHPGQIRNTEHLTHFLHANKGSHIPVWLRKDLASHIIAQHAPSGMAIPHPGIPVPMPDPQMQQQPQGYAQGGVINPPAPIQPITDNGQGGVSGGLAERKGPPHRQPFVPPRGLGNLAVGNNWGGNMTQKPPPRYLGPPVRTDLPNQSGSNGFMPHPPIQSVGWGSGDGSFMTDTPQTPTVVGGYPGPSDSPGNPANPPLEVSGAIRGGVTIPTDPNITPPEGSQAALMNQKFGGGKGPGFLQGYSKGGAVKKKAVKPSPKKK